MRNTIRTIAVASSSWLVSGTALAHPGHGAVSDSMSLAHYASDPLHLLPWVLAAGAVLVLVQWRLRRTLQARERRE